MPRKGYKQTEEHKNKGLHKHIEGQCPKYGSECGFFSKEFKEKMDSIIHKPRKRGYKHPLDCKHCIAITGDNSFYRNNPHPLKGISVAGKCGDPILCSKGCGRKIWPRALSRHERVCDGIDQRDYGPYWYCIRRFVYQRDNYACQDCGKKSKANYSDHTLVSHHILPFRIVKVHAEPNLITLCRKCHIKWHADDKEFYENWGTKIA